FRIAGDVERAALIDLREALSQLPPDSTAEGIQEVVYEIGRRPPFLDTSGKIKTPDGKPGVSLEWFNMLYQVLLGQEKGPRFGSFVAASRPRTTRNMIHGAPAPAAIRPHRLAGTTVSRPNASTVCHMWGARRLCHTS